MSQISPPLRILLAGAVVFLALWFTVLKPKSGGDATPAAATPTPATGNVNTGAPAQSGMGKVVQKAKTTAAGAEQSAKAAAGEATATPTAASGTSTGATNAPDAKPAAVAIPADVLAKLPHDVAAALSTRKVLVLAVLADDAKRWRPLADDDRYVRNTLEHVNRYDGGVLVKQVPLARLSAYGPLVNDLHVNQTPSIVVVDRDLKADVLTGYVDRVTINQAIADARDRSTSPRITDPYLQRLNDVCGQFEVRTTRWSLPTIPGDKALAASYLRLAAIYDAYGHGIGRLATPRRYRGLRTQIVAHLARQEGTARAMGRRAAHGKSTASLAPAGVAEANRLDRRLNALGVTACVANRRV